MDTTLCKTYGLNYNGQQWWARIYLPHGALGVTADNVGECVAKTLTPYGAALSVPLGVWRMDYNQNGVYFECRPEGEREAMASKLEALGFKRAKSAA